MFLLLERNNNRTLFQENVKEVRSLKTEREAEIQAQKRSAEWVARDMFVMGIWLKIESRYIEGIWVESKKWDILSFEIGGFLDQGYQGRGFTAEAAQRSLEFLFNDLNAHKAIAITRDTNPQSYKLAERLGFQREGHHRESGIDDGKRYGLIYYGMLRTEFSPNNPSHAYAISLSSPVK